MSTSKEVSMLEGPELDYWVAKAEGAYQQVEIKAGTVKEWNFANCTRALVPVDDYHPSTDWSQGGPIIEHNNIFIRPLWHATTGVNTGLWSAGKSKFFAIPNHWHHEGPTPLVAAMRAFVASEFGEEIL